MVLKLKGTLMMIAVQGRATRGRATQGRAPLLLKRLLSVEIENDCQRGIFPRWGDNNRLAIVAPAAYSSVRPERCHATGAGHPQPHGDPVL